MAQSPSAPPIGSSPSKAVQGAIERSAHEWQKDGDKTPAEALANRHTKDVIDPSSLKK